MHKILGELVTKPWQMKSVEQKLEASKVSRIDTVKTYLTSDCVKGYSGHWWHCAKEVFLLNGIDSFQFATSIKGFMVVVKIEIS